LPAADALEKETAATEEALRPQEKTLADVAARCSDMVLKLSSMKAAVSKNDARIQELMRMVVLK
jgi:hypothetical protein